VNRFPSIRNFCFGLAALLLACGAYAQSSSGAADDGNKPRHVITNDDLASGTDQSSAQPSQGGPSAQQAGDTATGDSGKKEAADSASSTDADAAAAEEDRRLHQAGGPDPNEKPKDAIKRIEREENELRSKLDQLRAKADNETSDNKRRMWLEAVDHQQVTLQQMAEERAKLQKAEDEKAAQAQQNGDEPAAADQPAAQGDAPTTSTP